jgi:hypothetical protein
MTTRRRCEGSVLATMEAAALRAERTVDFEVGVCEISCWRRSGGVRGL